jgi:hypothetical protein
MHNYCVVATTSVDNAPAVYRQAPPSIVGLTHKPRGGRGRRGKREGQEKGRGGETVTKKGKGEEK